MLTLTEILDLVAANRSKLREFGVLKLGVFGSHARGDASPDSDIDFLVELENETFRSYMGLKFFLEDLMGRKVDLVLLDTIKPRMRDEILDEVKYAEGL